MLRRTVLVGITLSAACAYSGGDFRYRARGLAFPGLRDTVGCLDVAVARQPDVTARAVRGQAAVLGYELGNRCDHPVRLDLSQLHVFGRTAAGDRVMLRAFDPRSELRVARLAARTAGGEVLAYPADQALVEVCVDVTSFAALQAPEAATRWMCFAHDGTARAIGEGSAW